MKNLLKNLLLLTTVFSLVFLFSCGDEDPEDEVLPAVPSVTVQMTVNGVTVSDMAEVQPGDSVGFSIDVAAEGGFNTLRATSAIDDGDPSNFGSEVTRSTLGVDAGTQNVSDIEFSTIITEVLLGSTVTFEFEAVDEEGQTGTESVEIEVVSPQARSYSAVLLVVPLGDKTGENFFSSSTGEVYSASEVTSTSEAISPLIDFGYYYGSTDQASIASPAGFENTNFAPQVENWNTKNATVIKATDLDASAFNEVTTFADIDEVFDAGTDEEGIITGLSEGDVVAFETVDGKRGLILITAQNGTFNEGDNIEIDVLVQEDAAE